MVTSSCGKCTPRVAARPAIAAILVAGIAWQAGALSSGPLPNRPDSLKVAVIGDNGTGDAAQYELARRMVLAHQTFPYESVLMMGDNFYGSQRPADLVRKFEVPYRLLLDAGVSFRAALGNHDEPATVNYPPLNMNGRRYYTFALKHVRFVVLDTNFLDPKQLQWAEATLAAATEAWKVCYFHHPLYSNAGRHGAAVEVRVLIEPLLIRTGVHVVFSGHDHIYERLKPQKGIHYFVSGAGGKLRKGDLQPSETSAFGFDQDQTFMLLEFDGPELFFQVISRSGATVDSGVIPRSAPRGTE